MRRPLLARLWPCLLAAPFAGDLTFSASSVCRARRTALSTLPPGRASLPLLGDTLKLLAPDTMGSYQVDSRRRWGDVWRTKVLFKNTIFVTGSDKLEAAFRAESRSKATKAFFPPHHRTLFGPDSLLVRSGEVHLKLRRLMQPALSAQAMAGYQKHIDAAVSEFVAAAKASAEPFLMVGALRSLLVKIMVQILLGRGVDPSQVQALVDDLATWSRGLLSAPTTFVPGTAAHRAMRARGRVAAVVRTWIQAMREAPPGDTLLSRLVHARDEATGEALADGAIVDNVFTLIFAGSDTTASLLSSSFLHLSRDEALQEQLRRWLADADGGQADAHISALLSELLRTCPPAPFQMRQVVEELEIGGYRVPRDWLLVYGYAGTLLDDERRYRSAGEFRLERWLPGATVDESAFGGGPRMCPGRFLATREAKSVLSAVLGREGFRWQLEPGQDTRQRYTPGFFPADGLKTRVVRAPVSSA